MKVWGIILFIVGILLILMNLFIYKASNSLPDNRTAPDGNIVSLIGYYVGYNLFLIVGAILVIVSLTAGKRSKKTN